MLPNREGTFIASVIEHGINEVGDNNLTAFVASFRLEYEATKLDWEEVTEDFVITAKAFLENKDGSINTTKVNMLKTAFGWDGRDPMWLQDTDLVGARAQLVIGSNSWTDKKTGQSRSGFEVKWINREDAKPGGVEKADDSLRAKIAAKLGPKLRAQAGGTPVKAPPPAGKPSAPPVPKPAAKLPPPTAPSAMASGITTKELAWANWQTHFADSDGDEIRASEWQRALKELFPNRDVDTLTAEEWVRFANDAPATITPF